MSRLFLSLFATVLAVSRTAAQPAIDYARENRWAQEVVASIVVGDAVWLATPLRAKVLAILALPSGVPKGGVVVIHGLGVHPDFGMIGGIRSYLVEAGYVTLSVQMPVLAAGASRDDYSITLPDAAGRIGVAIAFLRTKGIVNIAIVSHSMGATMADASLAREDAAKVDAWVPVGMFTDFASPPKEPILDVMAENELAQVVAAAPKRAKQLPRDACSGQVTISGTDHYFEVRQKELAAVIAAFLDRVFSGRC
jgi:pimeloyl-ACP methyl ester carboxylesterase